jgi:hypothetical protein
MVFARNALASGPGNACNSIHLSPTWRKVKGGKLISFIEPRFQLLKKLNRRARGERRAKDRKIGMME